jgi:hypothetical protein
MPGDCGSYLLLLQLFSVPGVKDTATLSIYSGKVELNDGNAGDALRGHR